MQPLVKLKNLLDQVSRKLHLDLSLAAEHVTTLNEACNLRECRTQTGPVSQEVIEEALRGLPSAVQKVVQGPKST